jgi:hypothetical protein
VYEKIKNNYFSKQKESNVANTNVSKGAIKRRIKPSTKSIYERVEEKPPGMEQKTLITLL